MLRSIIAARIAKDILDEEFEADRKDWSRRVTRRRRVELPLGAREEAELRRLVYRAFALRDGEPEAYRAALQAIEDWHVETLPDRLVRFEGRQA